jgi:hypothetical protein
MSGLAAISFGEWKKASQELDQALTLFRNTCVGVTWELSNAHTFLVGSLLYQGEFREAEAGSETPSRPRDSAAISITRPSFARASTACCCSWPTSLMRPSDKHMK